MIRIVQNVEIKIQKYNLSLLMKYQIHKRLSEMFSSVQDISFSEKVFVCEDFLQIPSVPGQPVFMFKETDVYEGFFNARFVAQI